MLLLATSTRKATMDSWKYMGLGDWWVVVRRQDVPGAQGRTGERVEIAWLLTVCLCHGPRDHGHRDNQW